MSDLRPSLRRWAAAVSRFVEVALALGSLDEVALALAELGIAFERIDEPLALHGGVECGDTPVDLRVAAGACESVEGFGFVTDAQGQVLLVCGEPDRRRLERTLVAPVQAVVARARLGVDPSLQVDTVTEEGGTIRLRIRPR